MLHGVRAALAAAMLCSAPTALAQAPGLFTGDDDDDFFNDWPFACVELTDGQVRSLVSRQGFASIYLNARHGEGIQVRATRAGWVYLLKVSTCTGWIEYGQRLRPAR